MRTKDDLYTDLRQISFEYTIESVMEPDETMSQWYSYIAAYVTDFLSMCDESGDLLETSSERKTSLQAFVAYCQSRMKDKHATYEEVIACREVQSVFLKHLKHL